MRVVFPAEQYVPGFQFPPDALGRFPYMGGCQWPHIVCEIAVLINGHYDGQAEFLPELIILGAAARCDMHDARAFLVRHHVPRNGGAVDLTLRGEILQRAVVRQPDQVLAFHRPDHYRFGRQDGLDE